MTSLLPILLAQMKFETPQTWMLVAGAVILIFVIVVFIVMMNYGKLWFQAYMSNARVTLWNLIGMSLRKVDARVIVQAKIMALQAGIATDPGNQISSRRL